MTGVVKVHLPVFNLEPFSKSDQPYWSALKAKAIDGASWSRFDWVEQTSGRILSQVQRSDTIKLPEARVNFSELVAFLKDRGALLCADEFHRLRLRGLQTPIGIRLMELVGQDPSLNNHASKFPILSFAKPGQQHGSTSMSPTWPERPAISIKE